MENVIEHHGILGQKWGVRRYQNKDGSLTTAGKQRAKQRAKQQKYNPKKVGDMSDDELSKRISRLRMEETYVQLMANKKSRETGFFVKFIKENGSKFMNQSADSVIRAFAENLGARIKNKKDDKKPDVRELLKKDVSKIDPKDMSELAKYCSDALKVSAAQAKLNPNS